MTATFLTPELVASLAVLVTAITGLIIALRGQAAQVVTAHQVTDTQAQVSAHGVTIDKVLKQTNGLASATDAHIVSLEHLLGDMHAVVMGMLPPSAPPTPTVTPPTPSPPTPAV